jgi:hypothetical protein
MENITDITQLYEYIVSIPDEELNIEQIVKKEMTLDIMNLKKFNMNHEQQIKLSQLLRLRNEYYENHTIELINFYELYESHRINISTKNRFMTFCIKNRDYMNFQRLYNIYERIEFYNDFANGMHWSDFNTLLIFFNNMNLTIIDKLGIILYFKPIIDDQIRDYITELLTDVPIADIYKDLLNIYNKSFFQIFFQVLFHISRQFMNINNEYFTTFLLKNKNIILNVFELLQQEGYDFLPNKNIFLNKFLKGNLEYNSIRFIQYLIENGAIPKKMERKKYKNDNQIVLDYLERYNIRSV